VPGVFAGEEGRGDDEGEGDAGARTPATDAEDMKHSNPYSDKQAQQQWSRSAFTVFQHGYLCMPSRRDPRNECGAVASQKQSAITRHSMALAPVAPNTR
jgi:hypothetical protein